MNNSPELFPLLFLSGVKEAPGKPMLFEKHEKMFVSAVRREVASQVNIMARALYSFGVRADGRVAFCGLSPSRPFWVTQMAALCLRVAAVNIPPALCKHNDCITILNETGSAVAIVETLQDAIALTAQAEKLPKLKHIICLRGRGEGNIPILDWSAVLSSGSTLPDHMSESLAMLKPTDTALLFYKPQQKKIGFTAIRYSHQQLVEHTQALVKILGNESINNSDTVLTSSSWNEPIECIASCFLPLRLGAAIQVNDCGEFGCLGNRPQVMVATASYIHGLKEYIEQHVKRSGWLEWNMLQKSLKYGHRKYVSEGKLGFFRKCFDRILKVTVLKSVVKLLGGNLRLIIGVDDAAHFETHLFFHTFGISVVELPQEAYRPE